MSIGTPAPTMSGVEDEVADLVRSIRRFNYTTPGEIRPRLAAIADRSELGHAEVEAMYVATLQESLDEQAGPIPSLIQRAWADQLES